MRSKRKILVVEDDAAVRRGLVDALQFQGYAVLEAADGPNGLDMALHRHYDLMLLDLVLPGTDGLDILRQVRPARPTLPVIILTARGQEDDRIRGLSLGADDYIVKPVHGAAPAGSGPGYACGTWTPRSWMRRVSYAPMLQELRGFREGQGAITHLAKIGQQPLQCIYRPAEASGL